MKRISRAVANKSKRPARYDLKAADRRRNLLVQVGLTAIVVLFAVGLVFYIVTTHGGKGSTAPRAVRVTSSKLVTKEGSKDPKAVVSFYEDFLCPACGNFERTFGATVSNLINSGAIAADYYMLGFLSSPQNDDYSSRAAAAAYCVADESIDAFRRFHSALFTKEIQPDEQGPKFPDNARLIELAREAGAAGKVPECVNSGKYLPLVNGLASSQKIRGTPTIRINGKDWRPSTPQGLVAAIKQIVGNVPGLDTAAAPPTP
jgi:protein-disulfide isomerase